MTFGYEQPFSFRIGSRPEPTVSSVRHGVTEITLSDGRLVRATLHVKAVKIDPNKPGTVDVSYNVIAEMMPVPETPIHGRARNDSVIRAVRPVGRGHSLGLTEPPSLHAIITMALNLEPLAVT